MISEVPITSSLQEGHPCSTLSSILWQSHRPLLEFRLKLFYSVLPCTRFCHVPPGNVFFRFLSAALLPPQLTRFHHTGLSPSSPHPLPLSRANPSFPTPPHPTPCCEASSLFIPTFIMSIFLVQKSSTWHFGVRYSNLVPLYPSNFIFSLANTPCCVMRPVLALFS